ncbi:immunoglobulin lambda-1 light chain-like isoform X2 [Hyperolius riggenbachi]|uniref:immunoglobulin lambda-1 light chain-like isoform X2 n=1 Tax=Hyperolius riggenbachi TaxID=752182 RepID=UPI0035A3A8E6
MKDVEENKSAQRKPTQVEHTNSMLIVSWPRFDPRTTVLQVIDAQMSLYQPQDSVTADIGDTAVITCVSSVDLETGKTVSWYKKSFNVTEIPETVKSCSSDKDGHKYGCENRDNKANLRIYNVQSDDAGVYYCSFHYVTVRKFGNGTTLITRVSSIQLGTGKGIYKQGSSAANSSIYILEPPSSDGTKQLACVVTSAPSSIYVTWSLSGTHHKGKMVYSKQLLNNWTVLNLLSLSLHSWDYGENITCNAWFTDPAVQTQWAIQNRDQSQTECQYFLGAAVFGDLLLLLSLTGHLISTYKLRGKKAEDARHQDSDSLDGIVYAHLDMSRLNQRRK